MSTFAPALSMTKEYIEQPHALLLTGLATLPADKLSGVPRYIRDSCAVISEITEGYIVLRQANKITASRVLIRPAIEAAMKLAAVRLDPNNLLNIAHTEAKGDGKLLTNFHNLAKLWLAEGRKGIGHRGRERVVEDRGVALPSRRIVERLHVTLQLVVYREREHL